jgi:hypothetical protein
MLMPTTERWERRARQQPRALVDHYAVAVIDLDWSGTSSRLATMATNPRR